MSARVQLVAVILAAGVVLTAAVVWRTGQGSTASAAGPIRVGVLHSLTGNTAISERDIAEATLMAIEEVNAAGGVLGRPVEPVVVDGRSDWPTFAAEAKRLLIEEHVSAIFGGYTSASRRTMVPVIEEHQGLLLYPTFYEGIEASQRVVYLGATPNQYIIPAVKWFMDNRGTTFSIVGSDYIFPRASAAIIRDQISYLGGQVLTEDYLPLGSSEVSPILEKIRDAEPQVIISLVVGDTNVPFFRGLRENGITPEDTPTLSLVIGEAEMTYLNAQEMAGNYVALNYFQDIDSEVNRNFLDRFRARSGAGAIMSDPMECAYVSVYLWAQAVVQAGTAVPDAVIESIRGQRFEAPEGTVYVDEENLHAWKTARIAEITFAGELEVIWSSGTMIHPVPYSVYRTGKQWERLVAQLYQGWGNSWAAPL